LTSSPSVGQRIEEIKLEVILDLAGYVPSRPLAFMHTSQPFPAGLDHADIETAAGMNVIVAYENLSSALWAAESLPGLFRQIPGGMKPRLSSWKFSTLQNLEDRALAIAAAVQADLIVITLSSGFRLLPASVESWLGKCLSGRRRANTAVAALFGRANLLDNADSPRLQTVQRLAKEAGCAFFCPTGEGSGIELRLACPAD
jgi:hypothetical protein